MYPTIWMKIKAIMLNERSQKIFKKQHIYDSMNTIFSEGKAVWMENRSKVSNVRYGKGLGIRGYSKELAE